MERPRIPTHTSKCSQTHLLLYFGAFEYASCADCWEETARLEICTIIQSCPFAKFEVGLDNVDAVIK